MLSSTLCSPVYLPLMLTVLDVYLTIGVGLDWAQGAMPLGYLRREIC